MISGKIRLLVFMSAMWAIVCAGFTYDVIQGEKEALHRQYFAVSGNADNESIRSGSSAADNRALTGVSESAYRKEVLELYWIFAPFLWLSLTLSGCIVAAGFILPIRFRSTRSK